MTYDLITVDWNKDQTRIWRHWAEKNCPTAKIITIPDTKPFPWCWSGGKINCWLYATNSRVIYTDTDTIITHDLEDVFAEMGEARVGASQRLKEDRLKHRYPNVMPILRRDYEFKIEPPNISTGMMVCRDFDPNLIYAIWAEVMNDSRFKDTLGKHHTTEEYAIAIACARFFDDPAQVWDIPHEIHGNIFHRRKNFGKAKIPWVMHYHKPKWAEWHGMGEYLNV